MKIINKLYNEEIILNFNKYKHVYSIEKEKIPGVTSVLNVIAKPALISWAARMATEHVQECIDPGISYDEVQLSAIFEGAKKAHWQKKKDAGDIGTLVHKWIEKYINGEDPGMPVNEQLQDSVNNFLGWVKEKDVKFLKAEEPAFSRKYKYAGTIDFICTIDKGLYIGDIKTSSGIYPESLLQTAAYRYARQEEYPSEKYVGIVIVRIGKDGSFETARIKDTDKYKVGKETITGLELYKEMVLAFLSAKQLQATLKKLKKYKEEE